MDPPLILSTSPRAVSMLSQIESEDSNAACLGRLSLAQFLCDLPAAIAKHNAHTTCEPNSPEDPISSLFSRLCLRHFEWSDHAHFDTTRSYTRNLLATDDSTYSLLLLCWNPEKESPIHDHPEAGCWMKVLQGAVEECRYRSSPNEDLECFQDEIYHEGGCVYIEDSMGYHKVGNPGSLPAVTLHLYIPPIRSCRMWTDCTKAPIRGNIVVCDHGSCRGDAHRPSRDSPTTSGNR